MRRIVILFAQLNVISYFRLVILSTVAFLSSIALAKEEAQMDYYF